jgi:hypothetical protein
MYVRYMYPIYAEVDLDSRAVVRVIVDDEHPSVPVEVLDDSFQPRPGVQTDDALQVAESVDWPSWDLGW